MAREEDLGKVFYKGWHLSYSMTLQRKKTIFSRGNCMNVNVWQCERGTTSSPNWLHSRVFKPSTKGAISTDPKGSRLVLVSTFITSQIQNHLLFPQSIYSVKKILKKSLKKNGRVRKITIFQPVMK